MVFFQGNLHDYLQEDLLAKLMNPFDFVPTEAFEIAPLEKADGDGEDDDNMINGDAGMFDDYIIREIEGTLYLGRIARYDFTDAEARAAFKFNESFQKYIASYCPVNTGRLLGSCFGFCDPNTLEITCWANTHYAEYVEFGTSYMAGQHYMQRSIEAAIIDAVPELSESMFDEMNAAIEEAATQAGSAWATGMFGNGLLGFFIGILASLLILIIMSPIIILLTALADICRIGAEAVHLKRVEAGLYSIESTSSDDYATRDFF